MLAFYYASAPESSFHIMRSYHPVTNYIDALAEVTREYVNYWPMLRTIHWDLQEDFNMQWYPPNGGFFALHCERNSANPECANRVMAWMTYLNDIEEGG